MKPLDRSGSQGVIRVDDAEAARAAVARIGAIAAGPLLVEEYVPGVEVAVEGLLRDGRRSSVLAVFDKPDPLVGPYFEETHLRHAVAPRPGDARARGRRDRRAPAPRSVWSKGRCTPSCGSTATACG